MIRLVNWKALEMKRNRRHRYRLGYNPFSHRGAALPNNPTAAYIRYRGRRRDQRGFGSRTAAPFFLAKTSPHARRREWEDRHRCR